MTTIERINTILAKRSLSDFVGLREDVYFDAKNSVGYNLATPTGRWELAKDAAGFANAEGGVLIVGLVTGPVLSEQTDAVTQLDLLSEASFDKSRVLGILKEYLYPPVKDITVEWIEDAVHPGLGVGVIRVPEQPHDRRFVLINRVIEESAELRQIAFGLATRKDSGTKPLTVEQIYLMCQNGRTQASERMNRLEDKLDYVIRRIHEYDDRQPQDALVQADDIERRINNIIDSNE